MISRNILLKVGAGVTFLVLVILFGLKFSQNQDDTPRQCNISYYLSLPQAKILNESELDSQKTYRSLDEAFKNPEQVYILDLTDKGISEIPSDIGRLRNLQLLYLGNTDFPFGELLTKKNQIKELPCEIGALTHLQYLNLNENGALTSFPEEVSNLTNLKVLSFHANPVSRDEVNKLKRLLPNTEVISFIGAAPPTPTIQP